MSPVAFLLQAILAFIVMLEASHGPPFGNSSATVTSSHIGSNRSTTGSEMEALLKWKSSLQGQGLNLLYSWNRTLPSCSWVGISCDGYGRIVILDLSSYNLNGTLQNLNFSSFPHLGTLVLRNNSLLGSIPPNIGNMSKLNHLDMSSNDLSGDIPSSIVNIANLSYLDLSSNNLGGSLRKELSALRSLTKLDLTSNKFSGPVPSWIGNLTNLVILAMGLNSLSGTIPPEVMMLTSLQYLSLYANQLTGTIPQEIGKLNSLGQLDLSNNHLSGHIPRTIGNMSHLVYFYLYGNNLSGPIPEEIGNIPRLVHLQFFQNHLTGPIPPSIGNFTILSSLRLEDNQLSGPVPKEIGQLESLSILALFYNGLRGSLPKEMGNLTRLTSLQLPFNNFDGELPPDICRGGRLTNLSVNSNSFTGPIPRSLKNCSMLVRVRLDHNQLTGDISDAFGTYPVLDYLDMSHNYLHGNLPLHAGQFGNLTLLNISNNNISGTIPPEIGNMKMLQALDLSGNHLSGGILKGLANLNLFKLFLDNNEFSGTIPPEIGAISKLTDLNLAKNRLVGDIPKQLGNCVEMLFLNLSGNELTESIPVEIANLQHLNSLDLSGNSLVGGIPQQFGQLQSLEILNLSHNMLSGRIPTTFNNMQALMTIDVSYNLLEGPVPDTKAFRNGSIDVVRGNKDLCGGIVGLKPCQTMHGVDGPTEKEDKRLLVILFPVLGVLLLFSFALGSLYFTIFRTKGNVENNLIAVDKNLLAIWSYDGRIVYEKIIEATEEFDSKYCIGFGAHGDVYKAQLSNDQIVAVKKLHVPVSVEETIGNSDISGKKAFTSEVSTLTEVRHRNIVKLHGFCSTSKHSFLVYEYLEAGSVESILSDHRIVKRFGWLKRRNVVRCVAGALCYLHHDRSPPIVHRDISCKNILLDEDYEAHVSDFGTARFIKNDSSNWTSFAGTFGYAAPELAYTMGINEKCDVYSFGIVTLELVMGRHPTDLISSISTSSEVQLKNILDPRLPHPIDETLADLIFVLKIAFSCLSYRPECRPSMKQVFQGLSAPRPDTPGSTLEIKLGELINVKDLNP